jgi:hypothetical protein
MSGWTAGHGRLAASALVVALLTVMATGCVSQHIADRADQRAMLGGLTQAQFETAMQVARRDAAREDARVATATAGVVTPARRSLLGVHGHACPPGTLLHIRLVGSFPRTPRLTLPGSDVTADVHGEDLVADPATGQVCAHSYLTGRIVTDLAMVKLYSG